MTQNQIDALNKIISIEKHLTHKQIAYWKDYSFITTWQFWVIILMLIIPLIILYFTIDKSKILLLGFYGFNIHSWFGYMDSISMKFGLVKYPYFDIPFFPSFSLEASLIPVLFMLVYQWTLNHNKNFYLYTLILCIFLAFVFKPILVFVDLFKIDNGMNHFKMLVVYIAVFLVSKAITSFFLYLQNKAANK